MTRDGLGDGVLAVWNDVAADAEGEFNDWYLAEHLAERLAIPGFVRARRWWNAAGSPRYFTFYEIRDVAVLRSPPYLAALGNPSARTRRIMPSFRNMNRSACRVLARLRHGDGGVAAVTLFSPDAQARAPLIAWLRADTVPRAAACSGVMAVQLWECDAAATRTNGFESTLRQGGDAAIDLAVVVEATRADEAAAAGAVLSRAGAHVSGKIEGSRTYTLLCARTAST